MYLKYHGGAWVAQLVKWPVLNFGWGLGVLVLETHGLPSQQPLATEWSSQLILISILLRKIHTDFKTLFFPWMQREAGRQRVTQLHLLKNMD